MHKLIEIRDYESTRDLMFQNIATQTIDKCFDDSELLSIDNFDFVIEDNTYECKILLIGNIDETGEKFYIVESEYVGNRRLTKLKNEIGDLYFIPYVDKEKNASICFLYTRKDILQVDLKIHPDFKD
ncbi:hypothetical protein [Streptococcus ruminantium]|uniref:hypothetical protein n=1 Tax=Streptococcus ruminantium TaxID=1917441 RepID=UPI0012DDAB69|nr:hypothetical protein [Streptococcus ruminantium]